MKNKKLIKSLIKEYNNISVIENVSFTIGKISNAICLLEWRSGLEYDISLDRLEFKDKIANVVYENIPIKHPTLCANITDHIIRTSKYKKLNSKLEKFWDKLEENYELCGYKSADHLFSHLDYID